MKSPFLLIILIGCCSPLGAGIISFDAAFKPDPDVDWKWLSAQRLTKGDPNYIPAGFTDALVVKVPVGRLVSSMEESDSVVLRFSFSKHDKTIKGSLGGLQQRWIGNIGYEFQLTESQDDKDGWSLIYQESRDGGAKIELKYVVVAKVEEGKLHVTMKKVEK